METKQYQFSFSELDVSRSEFEALLGYTTGPVPEPLPALIDEVFLHAPEHTGIRGGYCIHEHLQFKENGKKVIVGDVTLNTERVISRQLEKADMLCVFLCTAGEGIELWSREETQMGDPLKAYLVDTLGSLIVETAMDRIQLFLEHDLETKGLRITNRYSPGYCNWPVADQFNLFALLPADFCGVTLTGSALMRPLKSVSGVTGVGAEVRKKDYECSICDRKDCIYRQLRLTRKSR